MTVVLDASAVLAFAYGEPGSEKVAEMLDDCAISAVNAAEVVSKLVERKTSRDDMDAVWGLVSALVHDFGAAQAFASGRLRSTTRSAGLSLGDRACLALAQELEAKAITCDRAWAGLDVGVEIEVIR